MQQPTNGILRILGILMLIFMVQDVLNLVMVCLGLLSANPDILTIIVTVAFAAYVICKAVAGIFGIIYYANAKKVIRCIYASGASIAFCVLYMLTAFVAADGKIEIAALLLNLLSAVLIPAVFIYVALKARAQLLKDS